MGFPKVFPFFSFDTRLFCSKGPLLGPTYRQGSKPPSLSDRSDTLEPIQDPLRAATGGAQVNGRSSGWKNSMVFGHVLLGYIGIFLENSV